MGMIGKGIKYGALAIAGYLAINWGVDKVAFWRENPDDLKAKIEALKKELTAPSGKDTNVSKLEEQVKTLRSQLEKANEDAASAVDAVAQNNYNQGYGAGLDTGADQVVYSQYLTREELGLQPTDAPDFKGIQAIVLKDSNGNLDYRRSTLFIANRTGTRQQWETMYNGKSDSEWNSFMGPIDDQVFPKVEELVQSDLRH